MPLWKDEPKFEAQVVGRFLWKLTATIVVTLIVLAIVGLILDAVFDFDRVEVIEW